MKLENLKRLFTEEDAVSPVIGVILMVAITVILAAIIGAFVLGLGETTSNAPQASFTFEYDETNSNLTVTHDGGDAITDTNLNITAADGSPAEMQWNTSGSKVTAGDSVIFGGGSTDVDTSDTVRVVWTGDNGDSATLAKWTGPDA